MPTRDEVNDLLKQQNFSESEFMQEGESYDNWARRTGYTVTTPSGKLNALGLFTVGLIGITCFAFPPLLIVVLVLAHLIKRWNVDMSMFQK
jgi:hypothetical protein